jgi:hypothetical protein
MDLATLAILCVAIATAGVLFYSVQKLSEV